MKQEDLEKHADFIHSLARSLVQDEHHAADIAQTALVAALEHPPESDGAIRSWFSRVIRNFTASLYRGEKRRRKYEQDSLQIEKNAAADETTISAEEVAIRKEALRHMTEAVVALEEPYLSIIMLRFYEDLPAREAAEKLGIPHETAKTQIQRGLEKLRSNLDNRYGGHRKMWTMVIAPLAGLQVAALSSTAAASISAATAASGSSLGSSSALSHLLLLSGKVKLALAAALLIATGLALIPFITGSPREVPRPAAEQDTISIPTAIEASQMPPPVESGEVDEYNHPEKDPERLTLSPTGIFLSGTVTDLSSGSPVEDFDIRLQSRISGNRWKTIYQETVHDTGGLFSFALEKGGLFRFTVRSSGYSWKMFSRLRIPEKGGTTSLMVKLDTGLALSGRVVDDATNRPVAGAVVGPAEYSWETNLLRINFLKQKECCVYDVTDSDGRFALRGLQNSDGKFAAVHPDFAEGVVPAAAWETPENNVGVEIRLKRGFTISGRAFDDRGKPAPNLLIRVYGYDIPTTRPLMTGRDGRFRTPPVLPGRVILKTGDHSGEIDNDLDFTDEIRIVDIADRDVENITFGRAPDHVTWRGTFYGYDGNPIPGAIVMVCPALFDRWESENYGLARAIRCDDQGRFEVEKLTPGRFRVELSYSWRLPFQWKTVAFDQAGLVEMNINLSRNSSISGMVINDVTGAPFPGGRGKVRAWQHMEPHNSYSCYIDKNGCYELKGVEPGSYLLQARVDRLLSKKAIGVKVERGRPTAGQILPVSPQGKLRLAVEGFEAQTARSFSLSMADGATGRQYHLGRHRIGASGGHEEFFRLRAGLWTASFSFPGRGYIQREFEVHPDAVTDVIVSLEEIEKRKNPISLAGKVTYPDGSAASGTTLLFDPQSVPGLPEKISSITTTTDIVGNFTIKGLMPGRWAVASQLPAGGKASYPQLWIPHDAVTPCIYDIVLPDSSVNGDVYDSLTGLPFTDDSPSLWNVSLHDVNEDRYVSSYSGGQRGNMFQLACASGGDFQLLIKAEGYECYQSGAFSMRDRPNLFLGDVRLIPCGLIDLEVVDTASNPIGSYTITCDGLRIHPQRAVNGRQRYDKLPLGSVSFIVRADGFIERQITVTLLPGRPVEFRAVLHPTTRRDD